MNSTNPKVEIVYEEPLELLDESKHYNTNDLVKIVNKLVKRLNRYEQNR